jgi:membrane protein YdbS with pleckstrin-like domain
LDNTILLTIVLSILGSLGLDLTALVILVIIGLIIIILIKLFLVLIPAILVAIVVYFLTGDLFWTGIAFLVVAALSILSKL